MTPKITTKVRFQSLQRIGNKNARNKSSRKLFALCLDGLVDCEDPECCQSAACKGSQLCVSSPKPTDILLRKQPPAITASFFERMKFLIDEGSLQNYAKQETFNER